MSVKNFVKITCENLTGEIFHIQYVSNQWFLYMKWTRINRLYSFIYWQNVQLDKSLKPGIRVTVKLHEPTKESMSFVTITPAILWSSLLSFPDPKHYSGEVVSPSIPRVKSGVYWGYTVRFAHSFGAVFTESPYEVHRPTCVGTVSLKSWSRPEWLRLISCLLHIPFPLV